MPQPPQSNLREQFVAETIPVGFPWRLFIFSLTLFIFSIFVFFGLKFGYGAYINQQATDLDQQINGLAQRVSEEDQQNFINFYSQLVNLEKVLDRHEFTANIFSFLEKNTLGEVFYTNADFSSLDSSLVLKGTAISSERLIGQLSIFDRQPEVDRVVLDQMNTNDRGANFGITVSFNKSFFQQPAL